MDQIIDIMQPYWLGLLIGLIIGMERERSQGSDMQTFGVRTMALIGFLGAFAGSGVSAIYSGLTTLFVLIMIVLGYWRSTKNAGSDFGLTTEVSAFCVFVLGSISVNQPIVACVFGAFILALLAGRVWLHKLTRERISQREADALISLIVFGAGVLPLLPQNPVDPWDMFVPFKLGSIIFALALVQFSSYVLLKVFGERTGIILGGFLAGLVSSTAAFANISQDLSKGSNQSLSSHLCYGLMAIAATTFLSAAILLAGSSGLAHALVWSFISVFATLIALVGVGMFWAQKKTDRQSRQTKDPLNWKSQFAFALVLFVIIALTKVSVKFLGPQALFLVSFISGLFELQGVTFALSETKNFTQELASAMALAYCASVLSKMFLIMTARGAEWKGKLFISGALCLLLVAFVLPFLFVNVISI
ncbi:MgtC/SapB family protein [Bdellovibrio svalbardensis]|uniref:DUF4010 domain-containing protein n=1 Tax=Bdellovibrio svalbardensis TaxID=2972972 RepID=A0ABT6DMS1_9BACT|nr:DUF4010 domain-containing protein [Bdellovibrio svalbardensis]MDG0818171.1 DUF4010 domain-containing protein [Bdellovibrio svalbardensis]